MKKQYFLLAFFALLFAGAFAQPTISAPTPPTRTATNVVSIFSDAYTNVAGTDFFPNWGQTTVVSDVTIAGNATKKYATMNYQGVQFASAVNASSMTNLHIDLWTSNCTAFDVYLINTSPTTIEQSVTLTPTLAGWNSFDIALSKYSNIALNNIGQFKLVATPSGSSTVYLDNIYFWKASNVPTITGFSVPAKMVGDAPFTLTDPTSNSTGAFTYTSSNTSVATISGKTVTIKGGGTSIITATQAAAGAFVSGTTTATLVVSFPSPTTAAPTPTATAANVLSLFSDAYTNVAGTDWFPNWGQSTVVTDIMIAGNNTKKYDNLNYQGVQFASAVNATGMTNLHLDLWTPNCTAFDVFLINTGTSTVEQSVTITPTLAGWNSFDILLSKYNTIALNNIGQLKLVGTPAGTSVVYLDNIYFWKGGGGANAPTITGFSIPSKKVGDAPFAITTPTSNSTGAFTYTSANKSVATISGNIITVVGAGSSVITATQAAAGSFGAGTAITTFVVTGGTTGSTGPTTAAPTPPARNASDVVSLFSNAYTDVAGTDFFPNWGQNTQVADTAIAGNTTKVYSNMNYQGIQFASAVNAASMTSLHVDIWTSNCTEFIVYLINTSPSTIEQSYTITPTASGWNSYDIPLSSYTNIALNNIGQIKLVASPSGCKVYLDNLYFWKSSATPTITGFTIPAKKVGDAPFALTTPTSNSTGAFTYTSGNTKVATISGNMVTIVGAGTSIITATQAAAGGYISGSTTAALIVTFPPPTTAAPVPTQPAANVISLFSDSYSNVAGTDFYPNWGQTTGVAYDTIVGNNTMVYNNFNYQGIQLASSLNASKATNLHIDIWTPDCTSFDVFLINTTPTVMEQNVTLTPTTTGWNSFDILLTKFNTINLANIGQLKMVGIAGSTVFIDNIYFWANTPLPISLSSFAAAKVGNAAVLKFTTAFEQDNVGFQIQWKTAIGEWSTIGFVASKGNTNQATTYSFEDRTPIMGATNYYRLLQTDKNGKFSYSGIVTIDFGAKKIEALSFYPNPVKQQMTVVLGGNRASAAQLQVLNLKGQLVQTITVAPNTTTLRLNVQSLAKGTYLLVIKDGDTSSSVPFVKD